MKRIIKNFIEQRGYRIVKPINNKGKVDFSIKELQYGFVSPIANYSPWLGDPDFLKAYDQIKLNTLVDIYRCYELWKLVENVTRIDERAAILEVGVWKGGTAGIMASRLMKLNMPGILYLADTFEGVVKVNNTDEFYIGGEHSDTSQETVETLLNNSIGFKNFRILKGIFPDNTGDLVPAHVLFSICHIDVDVYDSAKGVIDWVWNRLVIGGVVVFDDYGFHWCTGVTRLVEEQRQLNDRIVIHNLNGHGLIIKIR